MQKKINSIWNPIIKNQNLLLICFFTVVVGYVGMIKNNDLIYDSLIYSQLSYTFTDQGIFNFVSFTPDIRGYLYPFIIHIFSVIGSPIGLSLRTSNIIANAFLVSTIITVIYSSFFQKQKTWISLLIKSIILLLFYVFWTDLIFYTLSDIWGIGFLIISIYFFNLVIAAPNSIKALLFSFVSGVFLYGAYNIRPIYLFTIPFILAVFIYSLIKSQKKVRSFLLPLVLSALGILICALPEMAINMHNLNTPTPFVRTNIGGSNLFLMQLEWGTYILRFDAVQISNLSLFETKYLYHVIKAKESVDNAYIGALSFKDPVAMAVFKDQMNSDTTLMDFIKLVFSNLPLYLKVSLTKLVNVFYMPYNYVYIKKLYNYFSFYAVLNYTLCFFSFLEIFRTIALHKKNKERLFNTNVVFLLITMIPCLILLLSACEARFFIPLYILLYCVFGFRCLTRDFLSFLFSNKIKVGFAFFSLLILLSFIWKYIFLTATTIPY